MLLKWNARLNLTAVRGPEEILHRHFLECIQCAQALPPVATLLDFGSGAGLPGIPIAILRPEVAVTLGESQAKKSAFLREAVRTLTLNAVIHDGRIESMPPARRFHAITLRAVDKMPQACAAALSRLAPGGWLAVFATASTEAAIRAATPGISWTRSIPLVGRDQSHLLIGQTQA